ncbi:MAG: penicillin-binding protein [Arachnia propionica]|nr:MAG: penicillin-binding protein [Arachnia propionica]
MLTFVLVSLLSGVLLAGLFAPFVALASGTATATAESFKYLPAELETPPQAERSRILMADGSVLGTFYNENRIYVTLDKIAPIMQEAQVAIEDHRFYEHGAIDMEGMARAFFRTLAGDTQGASTLTQQYVKLVQVEAAYARNDEEGIRKATEVTFERKIREMRYAMAIEEKLSKNEILERYLNIAYYGSGTYGVEAAARYYFGTTAKDLTLSQAALLAGIVKNPVAYDPIKYPQAALDRRDVVLNRMAQLNIITVAQAREAKQDTFDPSKVVKTPNGCITSEFPFLCEYVVRSLKSDQFASLGATPEERLNRLKRGGLTITTIIDPVAQREAEAAVAKLVKPTDPVLATTVLIQPGTGLIVGMAQSRPDMGEGEGETYWNYNVSRSMGGAEGYQAGSTFKPFTMAAAIELGYPPSKQYLSPRELDIQGMVFKDCQGPFVFRQDYTTHNYDTGYGLIDMMKAAQKSVNTYFMQLERDVGICASIDMAKKLGVEMASGDDLRSLHQAPSFVLGTAEVTPLSMAEAYATFAARGKHCDPIIVKSIVTKDGSELEVPSANCEQVLSPEVADGVNYVLKSVMDRGTGRPARMRDRRPAAGKTGTTNDNETVWFAGYTPDMAGVAMIAIDKTNPWYEDHRKTLKNVRLPSGTYLSGSGGGDAGQIWKAAMASALKDTPETPFTKPPKRILEGVKVKVPDVSRMSYSEAKKTLEAAGFTTVKWKVYSDRPKGTFLGAAPSRTATKFSTISLKVSNGPKPTPKPTPPPAQPSPPPQPPPGDQSSDG